MKITGSILKEARERKNITLNEVAYATKINLKALQAIEDGDVASLPPKAFVRGFVRVYAEYLKLDVNSIMVQFQEEMGSTKPVFAETLEAKDVKPVATPQSIGQVVTDPRSIEDEMKEGSSSLVKMAIFVVLILVVAVGIVAQKTFKKYESEKVSTDVGVPKEVESGARDESKNPKGSDAAVPGSKVESGHNAPGEISGLNAIVEGGLNSVPVTKVTTTLSHVTSTTLESSGKSVEGKPDKNSDGLKAGDKGADKTVEKPAHSEQKASDKSAENIAEKSGGKPSPKNPEDSAKDPVPGAGDVADEKSATKLKDKIPESKKIAGAAQVKSDGTKTENSRAGIDTHSELSADPIANPTPTAVVTTTTLALVPQELILEALDQVDVSFRVDGGTSQKLSLAPNQIHTFKAKGKLQLDVSDGGAINIIHNGQDRGVPGTLGQALKLRYP